MKDKNLELLQYLENTRSFFLSYHNHKEVMAWAGIVLFVALLTAIINVPNGTRVHPLFYKAGKTFAIVIFAMIVLNYLRVQFFLVSYASHVNAACFRLSAEILAAPEADFKLDLSLKPLGGISEEGVQAVYYLPKGILDLKDAMKNVGVSARQDLEMLGYLLVVFSSLVAIVCVWLTW